MNIAILLYDGMTTLDAVGPYEVLAHVPGNEVKFVARKSGLVTVDTGFLKLHAQYGFDEVGEADILVVPGGTDSADQERHEPTLDWIRRIHEGSTFTTSVCTGSLILGATGILKGLEATTHWSQLERLREYGATPSSRRVVVQGKVITGAGVSAGIDMGLQLLQRCAGDEAAQAIQLAIEYDPMPPFDSGSPQKASAPVLELVQNIMRG